MRISLSYEQFGRQHQLAYESPANWLTVEHHRCQRLLILVYLVFWNLLLGGRGSFPSHNKSSHNAADRGPTNGSCNGRSCRRGGCNDNCRGYSKRGKSQRKCKRLATLSLESRGFCILNRSFQHHPFTFLPMLRLTLGH